MMKNKIKLKPIDTAELLFKTLMGFISLNMSFDDKMGEPGNETLKKRAANYVLVRHGIIASDFIKNKRLEKEYAKYTANVGIEVWKIRERVEKERKK